MSLTKKCALAFCALLACSGCAMSNDEVIAETKKCEAAGMRAMPQVYLWSGHIAEVQCWPKEQP